jgi:SAM-dependent methyltransferase
MPDHATIEKYYQGEYREGHPIMFTDGNRASWIVSQLPWKTGTLLDVGCGNGLTLQKAKNAGWNVEGVEPDERTREISGKHGKIYASLDEVTGHYDWLVASHVIEHTPDALDFTKKLRTLADNFILIVPIESYGLVHLWAFREDGFDLLLKLAGFTDIKSGYTKGVHYWVICKGA